MERILVRSRDGFRWNVFEKVVRNNNFFAQDAVAVSAKSAVSVEV
jgi:hypothetical protein